MTARFLTPAGMPAALAGAAALGPRLLVTDASASVRDHLAQLGREKLLSVVVTATSREALLRARERPLHLALIDGALGGEALFLARELRSLPGLARLPMAFLSEGGDVEHRVAATRAGACLFLPKPVDPYAFGAAVDQMLALDGGEGMRVLVIDDDADFVASVAAVLEGEGIAVQTAPDATGLVEALEEGRPDMILLDAMLPTVSGWDAVRVIRTIPETRDVPILFVSGRADLASRVTAFEAGADDYLVKPFVREELLARVRVRLDRRRLLREVTEFDALTRCLSRRALLAALASRLSEARRHARDLAVALIDVDCFKSVNDTHGHIAGDRVLAALGRLLNERFRLEDLRGRWGAKNSSSCSRTLPAETAAAVLSRVLDEFRHIAFRNDRGESFFVTFSAGVASLPGDGASIDAILRAADQRLYDAKRGGRGYVVVAAPKASPEAGLSAGAP